MPTTCPPAPSDKKEYITDIGKILVQKHGKKKHYSPEEVKKAHQQSKWYEGLDFSCWAMCIFSSHGDFESYHLQHDETCEYVIMKGEMLQDLSSTVSEKWYEISEIDLDTSWLDMGDVFDGILEGITEFFGQILDGIS